MKKQIVIVISLMLISISMVAGAETCSLEKRTRIWDGIKNSNAKNFNVIIEKCGTCTFKERKELVGLYSSAEIVQMCTTEESNSQSQPSQSDYNNNRQPYPFCCDSFGNKRCTITINPGPDGSACFCTGQGWGYTCK